MTGVDEFAYAAFNSLRTSIKDFVTTMIIAQVFYLLGISYETEEVAVHLELSLVGLMLGVLASSALPEISYEDTYSHVYVPAFLFLEHACMVLLLIGNFGLLHYVGRLECRILCIFIGGDLLWLALALISVGLLYCECFGFLRKRRENYREQALSPQQPESRGDPHAHYKAFPEKAEL